MSILRSEIKNKFSTIPNSVIRDKELSDGDYRLMIYLYSLPNSWKINQSYLGKELNCSRENINRKIKRIKEAGYLEIVKETTKKDVDYIYILKERNDESMCQEISHPLCQQVSHVIASDVIASDTYINTNIINTDNKEEYIIKNNNENISSSNKDLFSYTEEAFGRTLNGIEYEMVNNWEDNELTRYAIEKSVSNGAKKLNYVKKVLSNYEKEGIKTVEEAKAKEEEYQKNKAKKEEIKKVEVIKTAVDERGITYQLLSNGKTRFIDVGGNHESGRNSRT